MTTLRPLSTMIAIAIVAIVGGHERAAAQVSGVPTGTPHVRSSAHPANTSCVQAGRWFDPATRQVLNTSNALARLKNTSIVLLGEVHTNADHHRWQLQTIAQLLAQNPNMILGFESFPRRVQPVLDKWVAGKLTVKKFLSQSDWNTVWRFDPKYYMALFQFARINRVPMVALNVGQDLITRVSQKGWNAVPARERQGVGTPAPATKSYLRFLRTVFEQHRKNDPKNADPFEYFVGAQQTWDRAMAEAARSALRAARTKNSTAYVVGIVGQGHIEYGYGLSYQLADMGVQNVAVLSPWDETRACSQLQDKAGTKVAELVFGLPARQTEALPSGPRLGVLIGPGKAGVLIKKVFADTVAATAGLKNGDLVVEAAGRKTPTPGMLVSAIKAMEPGTWLPISILRGGKRREIIARFPALRSAK